MVNPSAAFLCGRWVFVGNARRPGTDIRLPGAFAPCEARSCTVHSPAQRAPRLRVPLLIPPAVRRTPMPQPPARPNSTIPLRKLFFKDNSRFLANFSHCSTSLRRCVQKSAGNRRDLIIARPGEENALPWLGQVAAPASTPPGRRSFLLCTKTQTMLSPNKL